MAHATRVLSVAEASSAFTLRKGAPSELPLLQALDTAAGGLFDAIGLVVDLPPTHPFVSSETERWRHALENDRVLVATSAEGELAAFAVLGSRDAQPYLEQLSVHPLFMRRGLGSALLREVIASCGVRRLWLTTYAHVPWNAPYYGRFGFCVVPNAECGPELRDTLATQQAALPLPEQRVAMVRTPERA